jgi:hypothetical protein
VRGGRRGSWLQPAYAPGLLISAPGGELADGGIYLFLLFRPKTIGPAYIESNIASAGVTSFTARS